jgi:cytochrome c nitrite reductase small subunit
MRALILASAIVGVAIGVGGYTFAYARGASYLTDNPAACANCHIMTQQYEGWMKGSHRAVATCNDCHTPHDVVGKYMTKARNGFWHSYYFTTQTFHEPIRIGKASLAIAEAACRDCHKAVVDAIDAHPAGGEGISCVRCHPSVGHLQFGAVGSTEGSH